MHLRSLPSALTRLLPSHLPKLSHTLPFLLLFLPLAQTYHCISNTLPHPTVPDCQELIDGMATIAATIPHANRPILYARTIPSSYSSGHAPFRWQITETPTPNTCQVKVDATDEDPRAEEYLRLMDVVVGAQIVLTNCMILQGKLGYRRIGPTRRLVVKLERAEELPPGENGVVGGGLGDGWEELGRVNGTRVVGGAVGGGLEKDQTGIEVI